MEFRIFALEIKLNQIIPHNGYYISYKPAKEDELYSYLGGICNNLESHVIKVGGYTDHIHILCMLSKKVALMKLLEELKSHSSKWMKTKGAAYANFSWQNGYGAFSVNPGQVERVI
jgi:REP element-mobilizing transposase RayT